jgi:hypothetical protein
MTPRSCAYSSASAICFAMGSASSSGIDVRMVQRGQQLRFALEPRHALRINSHCRWQHLQRHLAAQLRIRRAVHLSHSARAQFGGDFVMRNGFPNHDLMAQSECFASSLRAFMDWLKACPAVLPAPNFFSTQSRVIVWPIF